MPLRYFLAWQYRAAGKLDKAESLYLELLKNKPDRRRLSRVVRPLSAGQAVRRPAVAMGESVEKIGVLETLDAEVADRLPAMPEAMRGIVERPRRPD